MTYYESDSLPRAPRMPDPGWLPDPARTDLERYWDGLSWTPRTRDRVTKLERIPMAPVAPARPQRRAGGRRLGGLVAIMVLLAAVYWAVGREGMLPAGAPLADDLVQHQPAAPEVPYPTFGSTDFVKYLAASMIAQEESIDITYWTQVAGLTLPAVTDAMHEVLTQNPYVFANAWAYSIGTGASSVSPDYTYAADVAEGRRVATQAAVAAGLDSLGVTADTPADEAARAIHDYIADAATYDFVAYEEIQGDPEASSARINQSQEAYGILVAGTAVCNGYAQAFQAMADAVGLETVIVTGEASSGVTTGGHAWNRVLVDGEWKTVDVTWDDRDDVGDTSHDFFLIDNNAEVLETRTADLDWAVDESLGLFGRGVG